MMGAFAVGVLVCVLAIPALARMFGGTDDGPSLLALILTWAAVVAVSGAYLFPMSVVLGFRRDWFNFGLACLAALQLILFVLLPLTLSGRETGMLERIVVGAASAVFALLVFGQIAKAGRRYVGSRWPAQAKGAMAALAAAAGILAQSVTATLVGDPPLEVVLSELGLLGVVSSAIAGFCLSEALDRSTAPPMVAVEGRGLIAKTIKIGVAVLLVLHVALVVFLSTTL